MINDCVIIAPNTCHPESHSEKSSWGITNVIPAARPIARYGKNSIRLKVGVGNGGMKAKKGRAAQWSRAGVNGGG